MCITLRCQGVMLLQGLVHRNGKDDLHLHICSACRVGNQSEFMLCHLRFVIAEKFTYFRRGKETTRGTRYRGKELYVSGARGDCICPPPKNSFFLNQMSNHHNFPPPSPYLCTSNFGNILLLILYAFE